MIRPCARERAGLHPRHPDPRDVGDRGMDGLQIWHVLAAGDGNVAWWAHIGGLLARASR